MQRTDGFGPRHPELLIVPLHDRVPRPSFALKVATFDIVLQVD